MPKLSIITINYNNCAGLRKTINSVVAQTFTDYEWIVIDGGSTDGSKELIEKNSSRFSFWCSEPDKGIYNAMNKGIDHANGDFLHFLNSGDWMYDNDSYQAIFDNDIKSDIIYSDVALVLKDNYKYIKKLPSNITLSFFFEDIINHQNALFSKELFCVRRYDESYKLAADHKSYIEYCLEGKTFSKVGTIISNFDAFGVGSTNDNLNHEERQKVIEELIPSLVIQDYQELIDFREKRRFVENRRLFKSIMNCVFSMCERLDPFMQKLDKKKLFKR